ncbi:cyanophycinase [Thalassococcus profundi]|uniref:Cyanophycinase n=1 Tax=Thalassococcus profundi TaxID=2282382 RepID=A0A369TPM0_9RHOB|nr:cyanophycinase [Thalassococcus profundi]RDD67223.1 cyanophycinase [Thalassococcus profundi]
MNMPVKVPAKGALIAIGGAEDKTSNAGILRRVLKLAEKDTPVVGVITTASSIPDEVFGGYKDVFSEIGAGEVLDIRIRDRKDSEAEKYVDMINRSDIVFISGGDQMRLTNILGASNAIAAIRQRHEEGMVVAGTSAGAACQSHTMVYGGPADDCLRKGAVKMAAGFGFVDDVIVDTHFLERGRFSRLMEVGATNPEYLGVGLGEDAAVMFDGPLLRVFGSGHVILIDSTGISGSNVFDLADGEAISVHNVTMHALVEGYAYSITDRRVLSPEELGAETLEHAFAYT